MEVCLCSGDGGARRDGGEVCGGRGHGALEGRGEMVNDGDVVVVGGDMGGMGEVGLVGVC